MPEERSDRRRRSVQNQILGWVLAIAVLYFGREVFIPLALAGLLAFLLAPVATSLEGVGLRRTPAVLIVTALSLAAVSAVCWVVLGQIYNLAVELPQYQQNVTEKIDALHLHSAGKLTSTIQMLSAVSREVSAPDEGATDLPVPAPIRGGASRHRRATPEPPLSAAASHDPDQPVTVRLEEPVSSVFGMAGRSLTPLIHPLTTAFIILVFVIFMLLARDDLRDRTIRLAGSSRMHVTTVAMGDASQRVSRYLLMQFVVNVTYGGVVGFALWGIGLPHPLLWAVLTCLLRFIPYVGILSAAAGPLLLAVAVSPHWMTVAWTFAVFVTLELIVSNAVEPFLYGSSTGVSALAILVAAIFWTWLWGVSGLLLSTPLTVCLIVIGRHFPPLEFFGVLFGEEAVLAPPQRLYQRLLAGDSAGAARVLGEFLEEKSREEVYDTVVLPSLSLVEEARHADLLDGETVEQILQNIEELTAEIGSKSTQPTSSSKAAVSRRSRTMFCWPARDLADEVAGELLVQSMGDRYSGHVLSVDLTLSDLLEAVAKGEPDVVCVVGVPPQAVRHIRLRCNQLRSRFPDLVVVACVMSAECDLSNIRGRIPIEDAQHVVCSIAQAREYLTALASPAEAALETVVSDTTSAGTEANHLTEELKNLDLLDPSDEQIFSRIASGLAKSFDAPIALVNPLAGERTWWRAQCGLPEDPADESSASRDVSFCSEPLPGKACLVLPDVCDDPRFSGDPFLKERGIRFFAGTPLLMQDGTEVGCLAVLDTRPRQITDQQREILTKLANSVMNAIELRSAPREAEESQAVTTKSL